MRLAILFAAAMLVGVAAPAAGPAAAAPASPDSLQALRKQYHSWVERLGGAQIKLQRARRRLKAARAAVEEQRSQRYPLGKAKARIDKQFSAAKTALADAESEFPVLLEQARRAGVPPGVLRPYRDFWDNYPADASSR